MDPNWLQQIEQLCQLALGNGIQDANQQLNVFHTSSDYIPQCRLILDNSQSAYAQLFASNSLEILVTQFWNNFSPEQKLEMRNYILSYLGQYAQSLEPYVIKSLTKLVCRITKLGWFDHQDHRNIIDETSSFLEASISHHIVGLKLLNALVDEMNTPTQGRTLTLHRKTAVSFRDQSLYSAFQIAITTLNRVHPREAMSGITDEEKANVAHEGLTLATNCLSFDFIGTNPEESAEDVSTVQVPSLWRPIVQDTNTMQLLFDFYMSSPPPISSMALQALVQLSSVRRSLFASEKERTDFLQALMSGIQLIMSREQGLTDEDNYHQFCRLLGRLKASYQLSELVKITHFIEWIQLSARFTVKSLQQWQYSMNSIHYLLALWGRLVAALPYLRADATDSQQPAILKQCVVGVVEAYIGTMLSSVDTVVRADGDIDDPLEDESSLREQMDRLPVLARLQYETTAQFMAQEFERCLTHYKHYLDFQPSPDVQIELKILEGRMTWLVHMIAAVIGAQISSEPHKRSEVELDGSLSKYVFILVQLLDYRLTQTSGAGKCDHKLEIAILSYFKSFKKTFMMDSTSSGPSIGSIPGGSPAHPLLSLALSSLSRGDDKEGEQSDRSIFAFMELGGGKDIMGIIVNKICSNIKYWHKDESILEETLEVFVELVSSYSSSKTLLGLETVHFLVHNHVGKEFPFLGYDNDNKHRITFYSALSRLVFSSSEDINNYFDAFIRPNLEILEHLSNLPGQSLRDPAVKVAIVGILRDLRGITTSTYNKRTYNLLFDALYPDSFQLFVRIAETWYDDWGVTTALFKFMQEFVHNKGQRIYFEQSSANGILLFRETSQIVCAYGSKILEVPVQSDIYLEKYKGIRLMLNTLTMALSGNYVNFGVFNLYADPALQVALDVSLQVCLKIPFADVMTYLKLSKAYYAFLDILFRNHLDVLSNLNSEIFIQLVKCIQEGLQSSDLSICAFCASAVDHLATYMFLNSTKERQKPTVTLIRMHMESEPDLYNQLMSTLFNTLLFTPHANHWAVTRPILSLILSSEAAYIGYKEQLIATQASAENQQKLRDEFDKLTQDIQISVETVNRDKFTQKLTLFRLSVRAFLTL